jgi:hypothetical protein
MDIPYSHILVATSLEQTVVKLLRIEGMGDSQSSNVR